MSNETERSEIDPIFKEVITDSFDRISVPIETEVEVSRLPRTIDVIVKLERFADLEKARTQTVFDYFRVHNQIEFKGKRDTLTRNGYHMIRGRTHLYVGEKKISASEMTVTIVSARKPIKVLRHCRDDVQWESLGVGRYKSTDLLPTYLFVCNELEIVPKNYPLLLFASSDTKIREFIEQIVGEENSIYVNYALEVEPETTLEVLQMSGKLNERQQYAKRIVDYLGDELFSHMDQDSIRRVVNYFGDELFSHMDESLIKNLIETQIGGLEAEDIRSLSPETRKNLIRLLQSVDEDQK